jgi:pimeloyl-ACP methyl ester carboxylesterase
MKTEKKPFLHLWSRIMIIAALIILACILIPLCIILLYSPGNPIPLLDNKANVVQGSLSEKSFINLNGMKQGIFIRTNNISNPVLLFLHGGPGMPTYFLTEKYPTGLENKFTVCYWEQTGGGISYNPDISADSITVERIISDAIEVTKYLQKRFGKEKIYLMGHSWGSFIGIQLTAKAPELYYAYIGVAQIANQKESEKLGYKYMIEQYQKSGNTGMMEKFKNYPIQESEAQIILYFKSSLRDETMHNLGIGTMHNMKSVITGIFFPVMFCKAYTFGEKINIWRAKSILINKTNLIEQLFSTDLFSKVSKVEIPVYFISGAYDYTVNYNLSREYLEHLQAPVKRFFLLEHSAHSPMHEEPEEFLKIMVENIIKE